ncbi:MAG: hypothetical protein AB7V58_12930 [Solirubrobacterales bacterium]
MNRRAHSRVVTDERPSADDVRDGRVAREATALIETEAVDPALAARRYEGLAAQNVRSYPGIFVAALCAVPLAKVLAQVVPGAQGSATGFLIVVVIGYLVPVTLYMRHALAGTRAFEDADPLRRAAGYLLAAGAVASNTALLVIAVSLVTSLLVTPVILVIAGISGTAPYEAGSPWTTAVVAPVWIAVFVFALSDTHPRSLYRPVAAVREIAAGLRVNAAKIMKILAGIAIVFVGLAPPTSIFSAGAAVVTGVLVALSLYRIEIDAETSALIELGRIRCDIRLGRLGVADHRMSVLYEQPAIAGADPTRHLVICLSKVAEGLESGPVLPLPLAPPREPAPASELEDSLDKAEKLASRSAHPQEWMACVAATRLLVEEFAAECSLRRTVNVQGAD